MHVGCASCAITGRTPIEAQFWQNEEFVYSRRFDTRALAVKWAEKEWKAFERGGA